MITANLVGFVIGTDGIMYMARGIAGSFQGNVAERASIFCVFINIDP